MRKDLVSITLKTKTIKEKMIALNIYMKKSIKLKK